MDNGVRCVFDDFMRSLQGGDAVTVSLRGVGEITYTTKEIYEAINFRVNHRHSPRPEALTDSAFERQLSDSGVHKDDIPQIIEIYKRHLRKNAKPEPLTLEQLREKIGEPVWVADLLIESCSDWHFVEEHDGEILLFDRIAFARKIVGYNATTGHNYGKTWLAYATKPETEGISDV